MSRKSGRKDYDDLVELHRHVQGFLHRELGGGGGTGVCWTPLTDAYEMDDRFVIMLEVPGVLREDMEITAQGCEVVVKGLRRTAPEFGKANFHQIEREFGTFRRVFQFEHALDADGVDASLVDGVLTITLPKALTKAAVPVK